MHHSALRHVQRREMGVGVGESKRDWPVGLCPAAAGLGKGVFETVR